MLASVNLYSETSSELNRFLSNFYNSTFDLNNKLNWKKEYANPIELAEIIGAFVDNCEKYHLNMWICLDKDVFIRITSKNADSIIKYLYERFPY